MKMYEGGGIHPPPPPPPRSDRVKAAYNVACTQWIRDHPRRRITVDRIGVLFSVAYMKAATVEIAASEFSKTGIHPFNPDVIPSADFVEAPSESTPHCLEAQSSQQSMPDGVTETCSEAPAKSAEAQPGPSTSNVEAGGNQNEKDQEEISFFHCCSISKKTQWVSRHIYTRSIRYFLYGHYATSKVARFKGQKEEKKRGISDNHQLSLQMKLELELVPGRAKQGLKNKGKKGSEEKGNVKTVHRNKKKGHMKPKRKQQIESTASLSHTRIQ